MPHTGQGGYIRRLVLDRSLKGPFRLFESIETAQSIAEANQRSHMCWLVLECAAKRRDGLFGAPHLQEFSPGFDLRVKMLVHCGLDGPAGTTHPIIRGTQMRARS